jgi:predicted unusual protein kinase regulating ubiquinone biosynthesis (AarF/ABC1/UbiB family)
MKDFGANIYDDYEDIVCVGSGSIAQVYKAKSRSDDKIVAIKVKHPNMESDMVFPYIFIILYKYIFRPTINLTVFLDNFCKQIDLTYEKHNLEKFRELYKNDSEILVFPEPIKGTQNILVTSFEDGKRLEEVSDITQRNTSRFMYIFCRDMSMIKGFLHCDLHKGNYRIRENPFRFVVYDTGFSEEYNPEIIKRTLELYDDLHLGEFLHHIALHHSVEKMNIDPDELEIKYTSISDNLCKPANVKNILTISNQMAKDYRVKIDPLVINVMIMFTILEDNFKKYAMEYDDTIENFQKVSVIKMFSFCKAYGIFEEYTKVLSEQIKSKFTSSLMSYPTQSVEVYYNNLKKGI